MEQAEIVAILESIASLLESGHEHSYTLLLRDALCRPDRSLRAFLQSNELWGGAGSIADQPFTGRPAERTELERLLVQVGRAQLRYGVVNVRTVGWVEAFEKRHQLGK